jgi:hypothetical protein
MCVLIDLSGDLNEFESINCVSTEETNRETKVCDLSFLRNCVRDSSELFLVSSVE